MEPYPFTVQPSAQEPNESLNYTIRLSIFLMYAECAGWAALVWALVVLHRHRKHKGRIPALVAIVLLNNMLELLLCPYIIAKLIQEDCDWDTITTCRTMTALWGASAISGVHLQQMMVLESVLALRYPSCSAHVFFTPCSTIIFIIGFICFFLFIFFYYLLPFLFLSVILLISVTVISWIVVCRTPPSEHSSNRTRKKPDCTLLAFTTTTLIIYLIFLTLGIFAALWQHIFLVLWMMSVCLMSLRVVVDPLLCLLVCKQKNIPSLVQTAVEAEQSQI